MSLRLRVGGAGAGGAGTGGAGAGRGGGSGGGGGGGGGTVPVRDLLLLVTCFLCDVDIPGKSGIPFVAPYSASKHALHGFADSVSLCNASSV